MGSLAQAFSFWVCGDDVDAKKPDPQGYRLAVERLGLPPRQLLALEDSANGVAAAAGADLPCLLTLSSLSRHEPADSLGTARAVVEGLASDDGSDMVQVRRGPLCRQPRITLAWLQELCAGP
jgi:beta-phosphoglucomutase-like phosphatase (HAD superfamily)